MQPRPKRSAFETSPRRRGGMYILVLFTATIVTIIGLSGLSAARIEFRQTQASQQTAIARFIAQSAIEAAACAISKDPTWRKSIAHDTWVGKSNLGVGTLAWKLVDEVNGSLTADTTAPVRVYGRGSVGETVRVCSVLVAEPVSPNLFQNGGVDVSVPPWTAYRVSQLSIVTDKQYAGAGCLKVEKRDSALTGAGQDIAGVIESGKTYEVKFWVMSADSLETIRGAVSITDDAGTHDTLKSLKVIGKTWTQVTWTIKPTWTGSLKTCTIAVCTSYDKSDFYLDEFTLREQASAGVTLTIVPNSWRRDVLP